MPMVTDIEMSQQRLILPVYPFGHGNGESPNATLVFELMTMEPPQQEGWCQGDSADTTGWYDEFEPGAVKSFLEESIDDGFK